MVSPLARLWTGRCTVYVLESTVNEETGRTEQTEREIIADQPCRLSFSSVRSASPESEAAVVRQSVKLFLSPSVSIPPGSRIVVIQNGRTGVYAQSGEPAVHSGHQEILLELWKGWG